MEASELWVCIAIMWFLLALLYWGDQRVRWPLRIKEDRILNCRPWLLYVIVPLTWISIIYFVLPTFR